MLKYIFVSGYTCGKHYRRDKRYRTGKGKGVVKGTDGITGTGVIMRTRGKGYKCDEQFHTHLSNSVKHTIQIYLNPELKNEYMFGEGYRYSNTYRCGKGYV